MYHNDKKVKTTMRQDFEKLGIFKKTKNLQESADEEVLDIPSPDPSTKAGLDDSNGEKSAQSTKANQPHPKDSPDDTSPLDPVTDGGSVGAGKGPKSASPVKGSKEASLKGEDKELDRVDQDETETDDKQTKVTDKDVVGSMKTPKVAAPKMETTDEKLDRVEALMAEMEEILEGLTELDEEELPMSHGFKLVAENSCTLADSLAELGESYDVDEALEVLEGLAEDSLAVAQILESEEESDDDDMDDEDADEKTHDIKTAKMKKEKAESLLHAMVATLMDAVEQYNATLAEEDDEDSEDVVAEDEQCEDCDDDEEEDEKESDDDDDKDEDDEDEDDNKKKEESRLDTFRQVREALAEGKKRLGK